MTDRLPRVFFMSADVMGCGFYRGFMPSFYLMEQGLAETRISARPEVFEAEIDWADVVVAQRQFAFDGALEYVAKKGKRLIVENDDYYDKIPSWSQAKIHFPAYRVAGLRRVMSLADMLTFTTKKLKDAYQFKGVPARICPNAVDTRIDHHYPIDVGQVRIGYHGSGTHTHDFIDTGCEAAVIDIMRQYKHVVFCVVGYCPPAILKEFKDRVVHTEWVPLHQFYNAIKAHLTHFNLAPITRCDFNEAKSNLKLLEYSLIRTPWVASDVGEYSPYTAASKGGLVVKNRYRDWYAALKKMVETPGVQRAEMGNRAREYVVANYDIRKVVAETWHPAIMECLDRPLNTRRTRLRVEPEKQSESQTLDLCAQQ